MLENMRDSKGNTFTVTCILQVMKYGECKIKCIGIKDGIATFKCVREDREFRLNQESLDKSFWEVVG